ncbi:MAG: M18 family aminopeptidase [Planctomycetota bacterium]|nr:M18 family aminopeptidase [Planctomycetota bacterium]
MQADAHVRDLLAFLDAAPTPYHAVAETARRLEAAGHTRFREEDAWALEPGTRGYVERHEGSIIAFIVGSVPPAEGGMRVIGAHTDSPNLRITPAATRDAQGTRQLLIEPYGGLLEYTWYDRDCGLAGRVRLADGRTVLIDVAGPLLRVPSLAIHLHREIRETGMKPNAQQHLHPLFALADGPTWEQVLDGALAAHDATYREVVTHDLMLYDAAGATLGGADDEFVFSGRLDNLASCHAALTALQQAGEAPERSRATQVIAFWDHEEVGSRSASGASGAFLRDVLTRIGGAGEDLPRAIARSLMVSVDMAHGVHPNHPERHDGAHMPQLGKGPTIKWNANQSYASDAETGAQFVEACRAAGFEPQHYSHRNDLRCGSTIGPLASAELGMRTVDVGNPMLSMHSCREMCAASDHEPMIAALRAHLVRS